MNPQYMMHQYGAQQPPQPPPQAYNQGRPSPSLTPQSGFQNVPLGPQPPKNTPMQNGPNQQPPNNIPNSFAPPPSQLPPQGRQLGQYGPPQPHESPQPSMSGPLRQQNLGGPQLSQGNPSPQASFNAPPPSNLAGPPLTSLRSAQPNLPVPPSSVLPGQMPSSIGAPPTNVTAPPPSSLNSIGPSPPNVAVPPQASSAGSSQNSLSGPPSSNLVGPPQSNLSRGPNAPFAAQSNFEGNPQLSFAAQQNPASFDQNKPNVQAQMPPPSQLPTEQPPPLKPPGAPQDLQHSLQGDKMGGQNIMNGTGFGPPPVGQPNLMGFAGQKLPPQPQQMNQFAPPPMGQQMNQFAPPMVPQNKFGQPPLPGQLKQPPLPSQQSQFNQPPLPGQQNQFNQPPLPMQQNQFNQYAPQQLTDQMQGMNISGPRQYPGLPQKQTNGDGAPHMPPPMSGQAFMNGQQNRGYPPMPGQAPMPSGPYSQAPSYQQQQQRRLDPDQMPNPIQVTQDDQRTRSGVFVTNQKGLVPPLVSTNFTVQDQGNASPRYIRSTMYNVPISQDLMKQSSVPFGLVISPMARTVGEEYPPPIVNFGDLGPVRCIRCKAYMCPYMQFIDSGRRFQCLFCKAATEVSNEYFQHLDHTGQRVDRFERPELILGTYELTATPDYCRNNVLPKPPAIIFVIDVSYNNIKSGLVQLLCSQMKEIIKHLPVDQGYEKSNMKVGFITYNSSVHFYNIKGTLAAPQMLVVGDTQEMFMPLLDGFLCTPEESSQVIDLLMEQIPIMFGDTRETETVLLPAILAGLEALKASECAGKLLVFHSTLPIAEAPGKLKNRDDRKLLGTDKERTVLTPQTQAYNQLGQDCVQVGCCVDLFVFNNAYIDIATIGQVARLSGGEVYKYTYFQADLDGDRLIKDIIHDISRPIAFDAIMRVRTSTGVRPTDFYGHFFMSNTTDMELAAVDCDKAVAVEVKHDDKLSEEEGVYIQVALLYTSCSGQRRLRIMNLALKTCSQMADLYRSCDLDTLINFVSKQSVYRLLEHNPKAVKDGIVNRAAQILANYRKNCASPSSAGQLILPECMKLLPLYVNCLLKSDALSGGSDITLDDRSFVMQAVMTMDVPSSVIYFYPRLIPLHDIKPTDEHVEIPPTIRCTFEKMTDQGVYILENGIHMFLWIGLNANPEFIQQVFGVPSPLQIDVDRVKLPVLDNKLNKCVHSIIQQIQNQKHRHMRLTIVRQREKLEPVFKHFLVEDRGADGSPSYVDFLCHMHKEIRTLLS